MNRVTNPVVQHRIDEFHRAHDIPPEFQPATRSLVVNVNPRSGHISIPPLIDLLQQLDDYIYTDRTDREDDVACLAVNFLLRYFDDTTAEPADAPSDAAHHNH